MKSITTILICLAFPAVALAHGGEDHGHEDAPAAPSAISGLPRVEAATEAFEVVGTLDGDVLALVVDRYETNEPVLNGKVEVEVDGAKSEARFRPEHGDYAVNDKALLAALARPGEHSVMFTVNAGNDSDLLEGAMQVAVAPGATSRITSDNTSTLPISGAVAGGGAIAIALGIIATLIMRRKTAMRK